jgi:putative DNA primase/helicase
MPDIDQVLRDDPDGLDGLLKAAEESEPVPPDPATVRATVMNRLSWSLDKQGNRTSPKANLATNVWAVLEGDPDFGTKIWFNQFTHVLMYGNRSFSDVDATNIRMRIYDLYGFEPQKSLVDETIQSVGDKFGRNPLTTWLKSCRWDGTPRIDDYAIKALGAPDTKLNRLLCRKWLIQAVARAMRPGVKADYALILVGEQGVRKSSTFRALSDPYFSDSPIEIGDRRAYLQMQYVWVYELAELDSIRRKDNNAVKAFLSSQEDVFVAPYGRYPTTAKRHTVFCGTTNRKEFLTDPTGSRRYWVVPAPAPDTDWVSEHRESLWAEAVHCFLQGEAWWLESSDATMVTSANMEFYDQDPWMEVIGGWAKMRLSSFSTTDVMRECLQIEKARMNRADENRVADILGQLGFEKISVGNGIERTYNWRRIRAKGIQPADAEDHDANVVPFGRKE